MFAKARGRVSAHPARDLAQGPVAGDRQTVGASDDEAQRMIETGEEPVAIIQGRERWVIGGE